MATLASQTSAASHQLDNDDEIYVLVDNGDRRVQLDELRKFLLASTVIQRTTDLSVPAGTDTAMTFATKAVEHLPVGLSGADITVPSAGWYLVGAQVVWDAWGPNPSAFIPVVNACTTGPITLSGHQNIDGFTTSVTSDATLVKDQENKSQNGVYNPATGAWTRRSNADSAAELTGLAVAIRFGGQAGTRWFQHRTITTLGTDPVEFVQLPSFRRMVLSLNGSPVAEHVMVLPDDAWQRSFAQVMPPVPVYVSDPAHAFNLSLYAPGGTTAKATATKGGLQMRISRMA